MSSDRMEKFYRYKITQLEENIKKILFFNYKRALYFLRRTNAIFSTII